MHRKRAQSVDATSSATADAFTTQLQTYRARRDSFIRADDLPLRPGYHSERDRTPHMYPGSLTREVKYLQRDERPAFALPLTSGAPSSHSVHNIDDSSTDVQSRRFLFTRRGSVDDLHVTKKGGFAHSTGGMEMRTNHSTINSGLPVANAGFLSFGADRKVASVKMSSGHYAPDDTSAVKLAMWADKHDAWDTSTVPITDRHDTQVDTGMARRVAVVNQWAARNPK